MVQGVRGNSCSRASTGSLGTFGGVFTPSILTILGIILFLRLGYVVGSAGLMRALVIIGLANGISVLTSISLSAIATNLKVKSGGDYYLISRTLGLELGELLALFSFSPSLSPSRFIALVFIPFRIRGNRLLGPFGSPLEELLTHMPVTALVLASEDIDLDAEPEEGKAGEMAVASDTLTDAKKDAEQAEQEATETTKQADKKERELAEARVTADQETIARMRREVREEKEEADKAVRQAAKARAKAENAAREAEAVGVKSSDEQETPSEQSDPKKVS